MHPTLGRQLDAFAKRGGGGIALHEQGIIDFLADGSHRPVAWSEVIDFSGLSSRSRVTVAFVPIVQTTSHRFVAVLSTGGWIVLDGAVDRVTELADLIDRATRTHRIQHRLQQIQQAGFTVMSDGGPAVTLTPDGVYERDRPLFRHIDIAGYNPANGGVNVSYRDARNRMRSLVLPSSSMDVRTTLALMEHLRGMAQQVSGHPPVGHPG